MRIRYPNNQLWLVMTIGTVFLLMARPVSAHTFLADHTIGAILHVDPNDQPVAGGRTTLHISFQDSAGKLDLAHCRCLVTIQRDGQSLATVTPVVGDKTHAYTSYIFPTSGVYQIVITGQASDGSFAAFSLSDDLRVESPQLAATHQQNGLVIVGVSTLIAAGGIIGYYGRVIRKKRIAGEGTEGS